MPSNQKIGFDQLLQDLEKKSGIVKQFRASFVKTRKMAVFTRELTSQGALVFQRPSSLSMTLSGDINLEIFSDGSQVTLIHDGKDKEVFHLQGDRDSVRFADPLTELLRGMGSGLLRKFTVQNQSEYPEGIVIDLKPVGDSRFERIRSTELQLTSHGAIQSAVFKFQNGDEDRTVFKNWSYLAADDPEVIKMLDRLRALADNKKSDEPLTRELEGIRVSDVRSSE